MLGYQAVTTPAASGPSIRAADPRSMGGIRVVNGVTTVIPPTTGASSRPLTSNGSTTRVVTAGPYSRQPTSAGGTTGTGASKSRVPPTNAPRAPRAHSQTTQYARVLNNPSIRDMQIHSSMEVMVEARMQEIAADARNGTLGPNFLPPNFVPQTRKADAPEVTRNKVRITAAAFKSAKPTDFIVEKEFLDIFIHARKFLVNGAFNLIRGSTEKAREKHFELYNGFEFENGLYAFAMRALEDLRSGKPELREKLSAGFESEDQLDVMEQALQIIANKDTVPDASDDRKTSAPSSDDNEDKTDMSIQVTTTIDQTCETIDPAVADTQPYGITTSATGPASSAAHVDASSPQHSITMGDIKYEFCATDASNFKGSGNSSVFPPGVHANLRLDFDTGDHLREYMIGNPAALYQSLVSFAAMLTGQAERSELESALATVYGISQPVSQGEAESEEFEQATAASSPVADESTLVHQSESVGSDTEKSDKDGYLLVDNSQTVEAYDSDELL